jgi:non-structural maintenance of chromosomes element 4
MGGARQLAREDGAEASDVELDDGDAPLDWDKIGRRVLGKSRRVPVIDFMSVVFLPFI